MARIMSFPIFRHLRSEPSRHVLHYASGRLLRSGRGLSFWYRPMVSGLAEVPLDDREQAFLFKGRTSDFQDVGIQGALTYRIASAEEIASRVDFSIDVERGTYLKEPFEQLTGMVTQLAQQLALDHVAHRSLREVLQEGPQALRDRIEQHLRESGELIGMGLELVSVRVARVAPTPELERALQAPAREAIQHAADEAAFQRRALAVEKERAIAENELQSKIELAKRAEALIMQEGANDQRRQSELAAALRIETTSAAETARMRAESDADILRTSAAAAAETARLRAEADAAVMRTMSSARAEAVDQVQGARNRAEALRLQAYAQLPPSIVMGLALREIAGKLNSINHLNVGADGLGTLLQDLLAAGTRRLESRT